MQHFAHKHICTYTFTQTKLATPKHNEEKINKGNKNKRKNW